MPTYEYHCLRCSHNFEHVYSIAEKERAEADRTLVCESCGSDEVEQVYGGFSILTGAHVRTNDDVAPSCCGGTSCC